MPINFSPTSYTSRNKNNFIYSLSNPHSYHFCINCICVFSTAQYRYNKKKYIFAKGVAHPWKKCCHCWWFLCSLDNVRDTYFRFITRQFIIVKRNVRQYLLSCFNFILFWPLPNLYSNLFCVHTSHLLLLWWSQC